MNLVIVLLEAMDMEMVRWWQCVIYGDTDVGEPNSVHPHINKKYIMWQ